MAIISQGLSIHVHVDIYACVNGKGMRERERPGTEASAQYIREKICSCEEETQGTTKI